MHKRVAGWHKTTVGEITESLKSGLSRKLSMEDIGLPVLRSNNLISGGEIDYTDIKYWYEDDPQGADTDNYILQDSDLLVNFINSINSIGKCALYSDRLKRKVIYTTNIMCLRVKNHVILPRYFLYLTQTASYEKYIQSITKPAVNQASFTTVDFKKWEFLLPPLAEQRKIAAILGVWDEAIAATEQLIVALRARKRALMQRLLTGEVRFPGFVQTTNTRETSIGIIPADWKDGNIETLGYVNTENADTNPEKEWHYIDLSAVNQGTINFPQELIKYKDLPSRAQRVLHRNDIIMATVRPNLLGYALAMFDPVNVICSTGFAIISPHRPEDANFIYQSLYSSQIQQQINEMITGSNYPAINSAEVKKLRLLIPQQEDERYSIGEVLSTVDNEIQTLSSYRQKLVLQKKGLMQRLLTGQVRVGVAAGSDPKISG